MKLGFLVGALTGQVLGQIDDFSQNESGADFARQMSMSAFAPDQPQTRIHNQDAWLDEAIEKYPRGDLTDFMKFIYDSDKSLHGGDVYGFFLSNQKKFQKAVISKSAKRFAKKVKSQRGNNQQRNVEFPIHPMVESGECPENIPGLVNWDYGSGEDVHVQIANRKVKLTKSITVGHLSVDDGGVLVIGEPDAGENVHRETIIVGDGSDNCWSECKTCTGTNCVGGPCDPCRDIISGSTHGFCCSQANWHTNDVGCTQEVRDAIRNSGVTGTSNHHTCVAKNIEETSGLELRALSISVREGGELWIGNKQCRYQHNAVITLYGDNNAMRNGYYFDPEDTWLENTSSDVSKGVLVPEEEGQLVRPTFWLGKKYLWCGKGSVCEIHGKEKKSWTVLNDHLFKDNSPVESKSFDYVTPDTGNFANAMHGIVYHRFSKYGAWKDAKHFYTLGDGGQPIIDFWADEANQCADDDYNCKDDIHIFFTIGHWNPAFSTWGATEFLPGALDIVLNTMQIPEELISTERSLDRFCVILKGKEKIFSASTVPMYQDAENSLLIVDQTFDLEGQVTGYQMNMHIELRYNGYSGSNVAKVSYSSPTNSISNPIITLADDVSSWEAGDAIAVGSTDFSQDHTEVFQLVTCPECNSNQVKLDKNSKYHHWGRIDSRSGIDQRAPVGILSRNIRIQGETGGEEGECQYARTRWSMHKFHQDGTANPTYGPAHDKSNCQFFQGSTVQGEHYKRPKNGDMHGGHVIITAEFSSVHISHTELSQMGQPTLARYPLHWHVCGDIGPDRYEDPSTFEYNSIHDSYSRFVTVHATDNAQVIGNVGYKTRGHGYFIEDGDERGTVFRDNLGMVVHQGVLLPTDKGNHLCNNAREDYGGTADTSTCGIVSVFWISNIMTALDGNFAVGGSTCYWILPHHNEIGLGNGGAAGLRAYLEKPPSPWTNNAGSSCPRAIMHENGVQDSTPTAGWPYNNPLLSKAGGWQAATPNNNALEQCLPVVYDNWRLHHFSLNWVRQGSVDFKNSQFSDCRQCWIWPTAECPGQYQALHHSTFQLYTENIGNYAPMGSTFNWFTVNGESQAGSVFTEDGGVGQVTTWLKGPDGVYRTMNGNNQFPNRGIQLYDTYYPQLHWNNAFYDFPYSKTQMNSAYGMHLGNQFAMTVDEAWVANDTFVNVGRRIFFGEHTQITFGMDWNGDGVKDMLNIGEKTSALWDKSGEFTGVPNTILSSKDFKSIHDDDCWEPGEEFGWAMACPRKRDFVGGVHQAWPCVDDGLGPHQGTKPGKQTWGMPGCNFSGKYMMNIQANERWGKEPMELPLSDQFFDRHEFRPGWQTNTSYHITFVDSPPMEKISFIPEFMEKNDWVRISYCLHGAEFKQMVQEEWYPEQYGWSYLRVAPDSRKTLKEVNSLEEMDSTNDVPSYYYDGEWLHLKSVGEYDIHEAGSIDMNGKGFLDNPTETVSWGYNEYADCHKEYGCPAIGIITKNNLQTLNSKCSQFECNDCAEGEHLIKKNTQTEFQNLDLTTQWEISIDIRLDDITSTWGNVFHVTKSGTNYGTLGNRSPTFFIKPGTTVLYMCYHLNNNPDSCYEHSTPFNLGQWYNIRVNQQKELISDEGDCVIHKYRIFIDNAEVYSLPNFDAHEISDALISIGGGTSGGGQYPAIGRFRNLQFNPDMPNLSVGLSPPVAARMNEHVIAENIDITPEYELSLDISLYKSDPNYWSNIIIAGNAPWGTMGTRMPAVVLKPGSPFVFTVCTGINTNMNHCNQQTNTPAVWGRFYKIKAAQRLQDDGTYKFTISVNGVESYSVINTNPQSYPGGKLETLDWTYDPLAGGHYCNIKYTPDLNHPEIYVSENLERPDPLTTQSPPITEPTPEPEPETCTSPVVVECHPNSVCVDRIDGGYDCVCDAGFRGEGNTCHDIDECSESANCAMNSQCSNTIGSYNCICDQGYSEDCPARGPCSCVDIDECTATVSPCAENASCNNIAGNFDCQCLAGYGGDGYLQCNVVDACLSGANDCDQNAECLNLCSGEYECKCNDGFTGDGLTCQPAEDVCPTQEPVTCPTQPPCPPTATCQTCQPETTCPTSMPATTEQPPVDDGLNAADCAGTVDYKFRSGKAKVSRSGENSNLVRLQQAKVKETKAHTGFVSFPKSACGKDFLAGLKDGRVTVDFADKKATYSVIGSYYVDNGSSTQVVVQYNSVPLNVADDKCPKCLGNSSTDQLEMLVMGTKNIEWGSKTAKSCLNGALVGHAGAAGAPTLLENDESGCVAWTNAL